MPCEILEQHAPHSNPPPGHVVLKQWRRSGCTEMLVPCEAAPDAGMLPAPGTSRLLARGRAFSAPSSTAWPQMTAAYLCSPGLIRCPASPSKIQFYGRSTHCSPSCCNTGPQMPSLLSSSARKASIHSIASLLHGTATRLAGKKTSKRPIACTQLIAKSCFTFESKSITRFDRRSRGHLNCLILPFSQSSVCSAFCFSKNTWLPAITDFGCVAPDAQKLTADCLKKVSSLNYGERGKRER